MKKAIHFVGIDVSKATLDLALIKNNDIKNIHSFIISNDKDGFKALKALLTKHKVCFEETIFCIEHTGYYSKPLYQYILSQQGLLWMEMSLKIIRSLGVQRGKNDQLDAKRIALYAQRNQDDFVPYKAPRKIIETLKTLLMLREKLITSRTAIMVPIKELCSIDKAAGEIALKAISKAINAIENNIAALDKQIEELVSQDSQLSQTQKLVCSVPGVGKITFYNMVYFTNEFQNYSEGKKLACYCGVVPFEYTSGSSVKGKPKVHNMANKNLKKLLHTAALCAVTYYPEFKEYYQRKVSEGKSKMLVLNNVRNKIVLRIAAVIKHQKPYAIKEIA